MASSMIVHFHNDILNDLRTMLWAIKMRYEFGHSGINGK